MRRCRKKKRTLKRGQNEELIARPVRFACVKNTGNNKQREVGNEIGIQGGSARRSTIAQSIHSVSGGTGESEQAKRKMEENRNVAGMALHEISRKRDMKRV